MSAKPYGPTTSNVVASVRTGENIPIRLAAEVLHGRVATARFPATIISGRLPTGTVNLFANGKCQWVGCSHRMDILTSVYTLMQLLALKLCHSGEFFYFAVCNVVCSASLGHKLDLSAIARDHQARVVYQPELFEGLQLNLERDSTRAHTITLIPFVSGRLLLTGGTSQEAHNEKFREVLPMLRSYRLDDTQPPVEMEDTTLTEETPLFQERRWITTPGTNTSCFLARVCRGMGGCWHTKEQWIMNTTQNLVCGECQQRVLPYTFKQQQDECEHDNSWTPNAMDTLQPMCDDCGLRTNTLELYQHFQQREQKRAARSERKNERRNKKPISTATQRSKRYKPVLVNNKQTKHTDARKAAEVRFEQQHNRVIAEQEQHSVLPLVPEPRTVLSYYRSNAPRAPE